MNTEIKITIAADGDEAKIELNGRVFELKAKGAGRITAKMPDEDTVGGIVANKVYSLVTGLMFATLRNLGDIPLDPWEENVDEETLDTFSRDVF